MGMSLGGPVVVGIDAIVGIDSIVGIDAIEGIDFLWRGCIPNGMRQWRRNRLPAF